MSRCPESTTNLSHGGEQLCSLESGHASIHIDERNGYWWSTYHVPRESPAPRILDLVKADLDARDAKGRQTYGSSLRADSPNDALQFAYDEALDLAMYLRQEIERRKGGQR